MRLGATPLNKYYEYDIAPLLRLFLLVVLFTQSGFGGRKKKEEKTMKKHTMNVYIRMKIFRRIDTEVVGC